MTQDEEIDFLHNRCDEITKMIIDLAEAAGQEELGARIFNYHHDMVKELFELRREQDESE